MGITPNNVRLTVKKIMFYRLGHYLCAPFRIITMGLEPPPIKIKAMKTTEKKEESVGFAIFSKILENKKAIEKSIKEGRSLSKIKGVKIAKPI